MWFCGWIGRSSPSTLVEVDLTSQLRRTHVEFDCRDPVWSGDEQTAGAGAGSAAGSAAAAAAAAAQRVQGGRANPPSDVHSSLA